MVGGKVCAIWEIFRLSTPSVGIHNSKKHLNFKFSWSVARCRVSVIFYFETDVKDSAIYLRGWQTFCLGSSARLICRKLKLLCNSTEQFSKNSRRYLVQLCEINDIGSSAPQFFTEDLDHSFLKNGWNIFSVTRVSQQAMRLSQ